MAESWYLFTPPSTPQVFNSGYETSEFLNYARDGFAEVVDETFAGRPVRLYFGNGLDEETAIDTRAVISNTTGNSDTQDHIRQIEAKIGELKLGMYVAFDGDIFLITSYVGNDQVHEKAIMLMCNYKFCWLNHNSEVVCRYIWRQDSTRFSSGESRNIEMVTGNVRNEIIMPKDPETIWLHRDQRFIMDDYDSAQIHDPLVYKITKENRILAVQKGNSLFSFIIEEDSFNPNTDNKELMIANYYNNLKQFTLTMITPTTVSLQKGRTLQIQVVAEVDGVQVTDGVEYSIYDEFASVSETGLITGLEVGSTVVYIRFQDKVTEIQLTITEATVAPTSTCAITYTGMPQLKVGGIAKTFKASFYEDGVATPKEAVWSLTDSQGNFPTYITVVSQGSIQIQLKCANDLRLIGSKFNLKLTDSNNSTQEILPIEIISLT